MPPIPRIPSVGAPVIVGTNGCPSQISERFTVCASFMKICGIVASCPCVVTS